MSTPPERPAASDAAWATRVIAALSSISDAVYFLDRDDRFTWLNPAAERLLAHPAADLLGRSVWEAFPALMGTDVPTIYHLARETQQMHEVEVVYEPLDRWLGGWVHPDPDGALVVFFRDIHERRTLDEERAAESSLIRAVLNALPARIAILDRDGTILTTNAPWEAGGGSDGKLLASQKGDNYLEVCHARAAAGDHDARAALEGLEAIFERRAPSFTLDYSAPSQARRSGDRTWWHLQAFGIDERPRVVISHTDITDRVTAEHRAAWQARHDHLTALPNRAALHEILGEALLEDDGGGQVTVLYMDVDGFKHVNDSLGHAAGDLLLRELASRLAHRTRPTDVVARLGGDEFVVVARDCDAAAGEALAERFRSVFDEPFELADNRLSLTVSIGIATSDSAHARPDQLLRDADVAMYAAKAGGRNRHALFTADMRATLDQRWQISSRLRDAASLGELRLLWQPVVDLSSEQATGAEALLRWHHPHRGVIPPSDFIPVAEENGLIVPITRWLLQVTTAQGAAWARDGLDLDIAVNISAMHFATGTLVDDVLGAVGESGLDPRRLVLELTETSVARNPVQAAEQFTRLREHGIRIAIDDFGAGYSSLSMVAALPADILKVDRTLVAGLSPLGPTAPEAVLAAVTALGAGLGMQVLAEGIETPTQLDLVRRLGCTHAQGFLFSPPVPAEQLGALLADSRQATGKQRLAPMDMDMDQQINAAD
ncbi:MAG: Diguanylate cyclase/phosphodiesterase with sensor(S) [Actinotalea sp.]|nr:Diguanylate cyclase/phosphodiesterase with sensor(S) [Actinotalea sp.]